MQDGKEVLLRTRDLKKYFPMGDKSEGGKQRLLRAVDGVSIEIFAGETLALVGESGSGKTTVGKTILRLLEPTGGEIFWRNEPITNISDKEMRILRREMQIIYQDPVDSLNPRRTVRQVLEEPLRYHKLVPHNQLRSRIEELLYEVGLDPVHMNRYPHEFSGGQRQRVGIARALSMNPKFIVCDEPVSALDVSIQAQILNLLTDLRKKQNLTYLFISHNLGVVRQISSRVMVMYLGMVMELCDSDTLFERPLHPYSKALLSAIPIPDPEKKRADRIVLQGDVPSPVDIPKGCRFHPRCAYMQPVCSEKEPVWEEVESGHFCMCHFAGKLGAMHKEAQT